MLQTPAHRIYLRVITPMVLHWAFERMYCFDEGILFVFHHFRRSGWVEDIQHRGVYAHALAAIRSGDGAIRHTDDLYIIVCAPLQCQLDLHIIYYCRTPHQWEWCIAIQRSHPGGDAVGGVDDFSYA